MVEYWRGKLNTDASGCYDKILLAMQKCQETIECGSVEPEDASESYYAVYKDHPELFYMNSTHRVTQYETRTVGLFSSSSRFTSSIETKHIYSAAQIAKCRAQIGAIVAGLKKKSEFECVQECLQYVVTNTDYELDYRMNQNAAAALCFHKAQCSGIARALKLLLDRLDVFCVVVEGEATGNDNKREAHAWNIVRVDGRYYHVDPTYMLGANPQKTPPLRYMYVFCDDSMMGKTHTWDRDSVPCCNDDSLYGKLNGRIQVNLPRLPFETATCFNSLSAFKTALGTMIDARKKRLVFAIDIAVTDATQRKQLITSSCNMVVQRKGIPLNYHLDMYDDGEAVLTLSYR